MNPQGCDAPASKPSSHLGPPRLGQNRFIRMRIDCLSRLNPLSYKFRRVQKFVGERRASVLGLRDCEDGDSGEKEDTRDSVWDWADGRLDCQVAAGKSVG